MRLPPITPGSKVRLSDEDAAPPAGAPSKDEALAGVTKLGRRMDELQDALYAEGRRAVLVVLQGRDTSGKDGTIRKVFERVQPAGAVGHQRSRRRRPSSSRTTISGASIKRCRPRATIGHLQPVALRGRARGAGAPAGAGVGLAPALRCRSTDSSAILVENGVAVLKFFLHISRDEQRQRLLARLEDPTKYWKFSADDLEERKLWDAYTTAYEEVLERTSTDLAPWYVVPADKKYLRDLLVAEVVAETLERMDPKYPGPPDGLEQFKQALQ